MNNCHFATMRVGEAILRKRIPETSLADFRQTIVDGSSDNRRVAALFGDAPKDSEPVVLYAVLSDSRHALLNVGKTTLEFDRFPSLTPDCPQIHLFEREMAWLNDAGVNRADGHFVNLLAFDSIIVADARPTPSSP